CLYMRLTDHLPLTPDLANWYFGGSSSDQAITLGGITPEGEDGVNDMTYIFLKVTEMLCLRDPNVNARFHPEKNSKTYLNRLCEVNLATTATPSIHNDAAVMAAIDGMGYAKEDLRDWGATGCVEPTLSGTHLGHTNFEMINMVAALEMAMNNGKHPIMDWKLGPGTPGIDFQDFDQFFTAFKEQFTFLADQSISYNEMLGRAHQVLRPTPFLSTLVEDCTKNAADVTRGGARYNSSGAACIGLADVVDSLMAVKTLVFDQKELSFTQLKKAVDDNFKTHAALLGKIQTQVPCFGSGEPGALAMAKRVTRMAQEIYNAHTNYRGGPYTAGFWSMSNHVVFGNLTGALPSGRLAGKPFTPGLTPQPHASDNLLRNLQD
ncbi:MAG: pyruvate formate lyase family protein, partial [Desulfovibrionales bacterium]|nr:pyruvate formate lyase family protein [Desulfovibrionales bacterium]